MSVPQTVSDVLVQSDETDSWYHGIVATLTGQTKDNKDTTLKTRGILPELTWMFTNSISKAARVKPQRSNDPTKQNESQEDTNSTKMQCIKENAFPLPKNKSRKPTSASGGSAGGGSETEEERLLTHLYHYLRKGHLSKY